MNSPRYMRVSKVFDVNREDLVKIWTVDDIEVDRSNIGLAGSPTRVKRSFTKGAKQAGKVFDVEAEEGANIIVDKLAGEFLI